MTSLFRQEVFTAKRNTWLGEIVLIRPTSFAFLTCVTALIVVVMLVYLFWGEYRWIEISTYKHSGWWWRFR